MKVYNKKGFLSPGSIRSMSCYHAKVKDNGECQFRLHDCNTGIRLLGDLTKPEDVLEIIEKLGNLECAARELRTWIVDNCET